MVKANRNKSCILLVLNQDKQKSSCEDEGKDLNVGSADQTKNLQYSDEDKKLDISIKE